jgi:endogenous inhibitor of DNA gyrase (YacG/DUF329 family)
MIKCPYCGKEVPAADFATHHATCEKRPKKIPVEEESVREEEVVEKEKEELSTLSEDLKRNIRESLVHALKTSIPKKESWMRELVVEEFYASLNRKNILLNYEAEEETKKAKEQLRS